MPTGLWLYAYYVFVALIVLETLLMIAVLRQITALHSHFVTNDPNAGLPLGALAPRLAGSDVFGRPLSLAAGRVRKTVLFFLSTNCSSCRPVMTLLPEISSRGNFELILVVGSSELKTKLFLEEHWPGAATPPFLIVADGRSDVGGRYRVFGVPHAVVVDEDERIGAQGTATTPAEVGVLLSQTDELRRRRWMSGQAGEPVALPVKVPSEPESASVFG
jgi:hypothetical protein